jgi:hypothetical protein
VMSHNCGLRGVWEELQSTINSFLDGRSLQSLIDAPTPRTPTPCPPSLREGETLLNTIPSSGTLVPPPQRAHPISGGPKKSL